MPPNAKPPHALKFAILAADVVAFAILEGALHVRLIEVRAPEYAGCKGLPGGLIHPEETAEEAAARHLLAKGGIARATLEQLYTFSGVDRDRRGRVVSVAYLGLLPAMTALEAAVTDWSGAWWPAAKLPPLAYDHAEIISVAVERLKGRIVSSNIAHALLPKTFTLSELQETYEIVLGRGLDKRNFRRKILALELVRETGETVMDGAHRPAALYRFQTTKPITMDVL